MAISPQPNASRYEIRSISLPSRSHPNILKIEAELKKLKTLEATSVPLEHTESLSGLAVLYKCVEEMLNLSMAQQAFTRYQNEKWVDGLLDGSIKVLDICDISREMVSQMKEHLQDLQCALRRRKGESSIQSTIDKFTCFRKKITKDAKKLISNLKQVDDVIGGSVVADLDHHLTAVITILMEVSAMTISVFESLFSFFSIKPKPSRWSIVSKMMHKGRVSCEDQVQGKVNRMENLEFALLNLWKYGSTNEGEKIQIAQDRLGEMEAYIESIENGLDCLFRHLIKTRTLLLNINSIM